VQSNQNIAVRYSCDLAKKRFVLEFPPKCQGFGVQRAVRKQFCITTQLLCTTLFHNIGQNEVET